MESSLRSHCNPGQDVTLQGKEETQVCCNIQFLTMVTGHCLAVGVRLAVPFWFSRAIRMKMNRVLQAVPLQPGRQGRWPIVKS
jgi:hypothetical protein